MTRFDPSPLQSSSPVNGKVPRAADVPPPTARVDSTALDEALATLFPESSVVEVRVIGGSDGRGEGVFTGTFASDATSTVLEYLGTIKRWKGAYVTLNRIRLKDDAGPAGKLIRGARATGNADIDHVQWLLVDLDPERPPGVSSTDEEHTAAIERAQAVRAFLVEEHAWPEPILASSGNGAHLLFRTDLAPESDLAKRLLEVLDGLFTDAEVGVDKSTYSPAQLTKLYGTRACKGEPTEERPHRISRILENPGRETLWESPVTEDQLRQFVEAHGETLTASEPPKSPASPSSSTGIRWEHTNYGGGWSLDRVRGFLADADIGVRCEKDMAYGTVLVLERCPMDDTHEVDLAAAVTQLSNGALSASCKHNRCSWGWKDLRARFDPEYGVGGTSVLANASKRDRLDITPSLIPELRPEPQSRRFRFYSPFEIMQEPPPDYLIKRVVNRGELAVLYGSPGAYKSFVTLDMALHIALGKTWHREGHLVRQGFVLYLAGEGIAGLTVRLRAWIQEWSGNAEGSSTELDESDPALQDFKHMCIGKEVPALVDSSETKSFVAAVLDQFPPESPPALIVIDTLARGFRGGDENHAGDMGRFLEACDEIRRKAKTAVLIVHHKGKDGHQERGSSALRAGVDVMIEAGAAGCPEKDEREVRLTFDKCKDGATPKELRLAMKLVHLGIDDEGEPVTSLVPEYLRESESGVPRQTAKAKAAGRGNPKSDQMILDFLGTLEANKTALVKEIIDGSGAPRSSLYKRLKVLRERGLIKCWGDAEPYAYSLPLGVVSPPSLTPEAGRDKRDLGVGEVVQQDRQSHPPVRGEGETGGETCSGPELDLTGETGGEGA